VSSSIRRNGFLIETGISSIDFTEILLQTSIPRIPEFHPSFNDVQTRSTCLLQGTAKAAEVAVSSQHGTIQRSKTYTLHRLVDVPALKGPAYGKKTL
jgi:hypothetical protein